MIELAAVDPKPLKDLVSMRQRDTMRQSGHSQQKCPYIKGWLMYRRNSILHICGQIAGDATVLGIALATGRNSKEINLARWFTDEQIKEFWDEYLKAYPDGLERTHFLMNHPPREHERLFMDLNREKIEVAKTLAFFREAIATDINLMAKFLIDASIYARTLRKT